MTGWDLLRVFQRGTGLFWPAAQAQIYPELRQMENDGLLTAMTLQRGKRNRREYSITPGGLESLRKWLADSGGYGPECERDAARLRAQYLDLVDFDTARSFFSNHADYHGQRLTEAKARKENILSGGSQLLQRRLLRRARHEHDTIIAYKCYALDGQIARAEAEITWANGGLELVNRLETLSRQKPRAVS